VPVDTGASAEQTAAGQTVMPTSTVQVSWQAVFKHGLIAFTSE